MKQILIISCKKDYHPTSVIILLEQKKIPFFRLNTEALMVDYEFEWRYNGQSPFLWIKDKETGKELLGDDILSIWYRRPLEPSEMPYDIDEVVNKHNREESKAFYLYLMYYLSDIYSIGNHFYEKYAHSKLVQLKLAAEMGMKIPNTCFSNTKNKIVDFARNYSDIILKPLHSYGLWYNAQLTYTLYTTKIANKDIFNIPVESFTQTVNFCEDYVEKMYEVRVTIMGKYTFACKLDSQAQDNETGKIDWRQGYDYNIHHERMLLPKEIEGFCKIFLKRLKLNFGCFDFIVTPNNEYVFLECNPNGQWGWIEDELNLPMSEALVDCLLNRICV